MQEFPLLDPSLTSRKSDMESLWGFRAMFPSDGGSVEISNTSLRGEAVGPVLPVSFSLGTVPFRGEKLVSHIARIHEWFILTRTRSKHSNRPSLAPRSAALLTKTYSRLLNTMKSYEAFRKELTFDRPKRIV